MSTVVVDNPSPEPPPDPTPPPAPDPTQVVALEKLMELVARVEQLEAKIAQEIMRVEERVSQDTVLRSEMHVALDRRIGDIETLLAEDPSLDPEPTPEPVVVAPPVVTEDAPPSFLDRLHKIL